MTALQRSLIAAAILASLALGAKAQPLAPTQETKGETVRTGKERLSDKASDEQRLDNCKVPPERWGAKIRSDSCNHQGSSALVN